MPANTGHIGDIFAWVQSACIVHALLIQKKQHFGADNLHTINPRYDFAHDWFR